jgi:glycerol-3-phosphate dehydrogenase (NAD(P)+)
MPLMNRKTKVAVIGAGSWGTAIAGCLSENGYETFLWGHQKVHIRELLEYRENKKYLPGLYFKKNLHPTAELNEALKDTKTVCMVVPSHCFRDVFRDVCKYVEPHSNIISAVKGIEVGTLMTMTQVMSDIISGIGLKEVIISVLSGPSFAREVADGYPTAVTIGNNDIYRARELQKIFSTDKLRVYTSCDVIGIEICAALKNVVAIAAGIADGIGYGLNARAAIITRGLAEISRLGMKMGADIHTFSGLSGVGDLILTCTGDLSRNRSLGIKLGKGMQLKEILDGMEMVAEGVKTTQSAYSLAEKHGVEMPILEQVYQILYEKKDCAKAVTDLLNRELKDE